MLLQLAENGLQEFSRDTTAFGKLARGKQPAVAVFRKDRQRLERVHGFSGEHGWSRCGLATREEQRACHPVCRAIKVAEVTARPWLVLGTVKYHGLTVRAGPVSACQLVIPEFPDRLFREPGTSRRFVAVSSK